MSFLLRSASTMLLVLLSLLHMAPACGDTLPFTVKVSRVASPTLPEYFDPHTHRVAEWMGHRLPCLQRGHRWRNVDHLQERVFAEGHPLQGQPHRQRGPAAGRHAQPHKSHLRHGRQSVPAGRDVVRPRPNKKLYGPMHCEYKGYTSGAGIVSRQIHLASSTDKGLTWNYEGPLLTGDTSVPPFAHSGSYWEGGDGDFYLFVDEPGGYHLPVHDLLPLAKAGRERPVFHAAPRRSLQDQRQDGARQVAAVLRRRLGPTRDRRQSLLRGRPPRDLQLLPEEIREFQLWLEPVVLQRPVAAGLVAMLQHSGRLLGHAEEPRDARPSTRTGSTRGCAVGQCTSIPTSKVGTPVRAICTDSSSVRARRATWPDISAGALASTRRTSSIPRGKGIRRPIRCGPMASRATTAATRSRAAGCARFAATMRRRSTPVRGSRRRRRSLHASATSAATAWR